MQIRIGCTGWSYEGWKGTFYPNSLNRYNWLRYYSSIFDITEINSTFYRIPDRFLTQRWNDETPSHFRFTVKFPQAITHDKKLKDVQTEVLNFMSSLAPVHEKILALVLQLPPSLSFDEAQPRLEEMFSYLPNDFEYPIEGRHTSWFTDDAIGYLKANNHCLVWNEVAGVNNPMPITSDYLYVRLIGDRSIPDSDFGRVVKNQDILIESWAKRLQEHQANPKIRLAMVMANNHFEGFGPATANSLRMKLGMAELVWEEKKQQKLG